MSYTKKEVAEITGLEPRQIQFYTERKLIIPEADNAQGRGKVRRYSDKNIFEFVIVQQLFAYGITASKIEMYLNIIRETGILGKALKNVDSYIILYTRDNGRYVKPDFRLSVNASFELKLINDYDSVLVINLSRVSSKLN